MISLRPLRKLLDPFEFMEGTFALTDLSQVGVLPFGFLDQVRELNIEDLGGHIQRPGVAEYEASVGSSEEGVQRSHTESIEFRGVKYLMHIATSTALAQLCSTKHIPHDALRARLALCVTRMISICGAQSRRVHAQ